MLYENYTPIWDPTANQPSGVTPGTAYIPTIVPEDWALVESDQSHAVYHYVGAEGLTPSSPRVELQCRTVSNPYGADKQNMVPLSLQVPGLVSRKIYINLSQVATVNPSCEACDQKEVLLKSSMMFEIPVGTDLSDDDLRHQAAAMVAWMSKAIEQGTVVPMDRALAMANGALQI